MTRFATTIPLLKEGRIDMIDSHMWYAPQPAAQVMMSPYGADTRAIDVHTFANYAAVLQALSAGQVDGAFIRTEQAHWYRKKGQNRFRTVLAGYDPHAEALAFKERALASPVSKVLDEMYADGSLQKIFSPYGHCLLPAPYMVTTGPIPAPQCGRTVP